MRPYPTAELDPYSAELVALQRRRALADAQIQQGLDTSPIRHWSQGAARLAAAILGRRDAAAADEEIAALARRREGEREAEMAQVAGLFAPVEQPVTRDDEGNPMPSAQRSRADLARALIGMKSPEFQRMGLQVAMERPKEPEAFTLSPGQARFRGGQKVAEVPAEAPKPERPPEAIRLSQIANDPARPEFERRTAAALLAKMTTHAPATTVNVNGPKEQFKNEKTLRDEFADASKSFTKVRDAFSQVRDSLAGEITAPATLAAATKFMKMLDPDSVVRESELNMALKSTGMLDRFTNLHNVVMKGGVLTPTQAKEIQRIAGVLYQTAEAQQKRVGDYYTGLATEYGLDPSRVVRDVSLMKREPAAGGAKAPGGAPARVTSDAEYEALPSGAVFVGPDGKTRRKP